MIAILLALFLAALPAAAAQHQAPLSQRQFAAGQASLEHRDYAAAAWAFRQVLLADPADQEARRLLAVALYEVSYHRAVDAGAKGDWIRARDGFLEALDAAPDSRTAREGLREARCRIAERDRDRHGLEECLVARPQDAGAKRAIAAIDFRLERLQWLRSGNFLQLDRTGGTAELANAPGLELYVAYRRRLQFFEQWGIWMGAAYLVLLLGGTWAGLRLRVSEP